MFFSNLISGTEYELKNRYMHVDYVDDNSKSVSPKVPKSQFDTLECTLEELAILKRLYKNPSIKQKELVAETGKSLSTVKRIMDSDRLSPCLEHLRKRLLSKDGKAPVIF